MKNKTISIKFYAIGEKGFCASGNFLSLDRIEQTMYHFANLSDEQIGNAVGEMLNDTSSEEDLTAKYGSNRTDLILDLSATFLARDIDFDEARQEIPRDVLLGITCFRTRDPSTNELGYLTVDHGNFGADSTGYNLQTAEFPNKIWIDWAAQHGPQRIQLYHENSKAHEYFWFVDELKNIPNKVMNMEMELMNASNEEELNEIYSKYGFKF